MLGRLLPTSIAFAAAIAVGCSCPPIPAAHGRIIDRWGEPVAGATLSSRDGAEVVADAEGKYTLSEQPGRASGEQCASRGQVAVHHESCASENVHTFSSGQEIALRCCPLATTFTFAGTIVDQSGAPLEGATVQQLDRGEALKGAVAKSASDGKMIVKYDGTKPGLRLSNALTPECEVKFQITRDGCTPLIRVVEKLPIGTSERLIDLGVVELTCS